MGRLGGGGHWVCDYNNNVLFCQRKIISFLFFIYSSYKKHTGGLNDFKNAEFTITIAAPNITVLFQKSVVRIYPTGYITYSSGDENWTSSKIKLRLSLGAPRGYEARAALIF